MAKDLPPSVLEASWQPPPPPPTTQQTWPPAFKSRPPRQGPPPDEKVARGAKRAKKAVEILGLISEDAAGAAAATAGDTAAERAKADGKSPEEVAAAACPHCTDTRNVTLVSPSVTADTSLLATTTEHSPAQLDNIPTVLRARAVFCITSHNLNHASRLAREAGLGRIPEVGDLLVTCLCNPTQPRRCAVGCNDWCPFGSYTNRHCFPHSFTIGPVQEVRIVTFPSTPAMRNALEGRPMNYFEKGLGLSVAIPNPDGGTFVVNITNNRGESKTLKLIVQ